MENIIFLDIDGVLNDIRVKFREESVNVVKELIKIYNAKVVMITSWQSNGTINIRKAVANRLEEQGIYDVDFIEPNFKGHFLNIEVPDRVLGIIDYLKNHDVSSYVILDDDYHNDYKLLCLNHYRTLPLKGLTYKDLYKKSFKKVNLNNFKYVNYDYRKLGAYEQVTNDLIKVLKKIERNRIN